MDILRDKGKKNKKKKKDWLGTLCPGWIRTLIEKHRMWLKNYQHALMKKG